MTDTTITITPPVHGVYNVSLPRPALIPVKAIREKWEKLIAANNRWTDLVRTRSSSERAVLDAESRDAQRMAELYDMGEGDDADPREEKIIAENALKDCIARIEPARQAAVIAHRELREAIAAGREEWREITRREAEGARDKLALASKSVRTQYAVLDASVGVLEMLQNDTLPSALISSWTFGSIETNIAIDALSTAVATVDNRVRSL
jgi:hypothetical protein